MIDCTPLMPASVRPRRAVPRAPLYRRSSACRICAGHPRRITTTQSERALIRAARRAPRRRARPDPRAPHLAGCAGSAPLWLGAERLGFDGVGLAQRSRNIAAAPTHQDLRDRENFRDRPPSPTSRATRSRPAWTGHRVGLPWPPRPRRPACATAWRGAGHDRARHAHQRGGLDLFLRHGATLVATFIPTCTRPSWCRPPADSCGASRSPRTMCPRLPQGLALRHEGHGGLRSRTATSSSSLRRCWRWGCRRSRPSPRAAPPPRHWAQDRTGPSSPASGPTSSPRRWPEPDVSRYATWRSS